MVILGELSVGKSALCRNFFQKNQYQSQKLSGKFQKKDDFVPELLEESYNDSSKNREYNYQIV